MSAAFQYQFRLALAGDSEVGKTGLVKYFETGDCPFRNRKLPKTVGADYYAKIVQLGSGELMNVKLDVWDLAGAPKYRSITRSYFRNTAGFLLVYDVTQQESFKNVVEWYEDTRLQCLPRRAVYTLVGTKADMAGGSDSKLRVSEDDGKRLARFYNMNFFEASSSTGLNVETVFMTTAEQIYDRVQRGELTGDETWEGVKDGQIATGDEEAVGKNGFRHRKAGCTLI